MGHCVFTTIALKTRSLRNLLPALCHGSSFVLEASLNPDLKDQECVSPSEGARIPTSATHKDPSHQYHISSSFQQSFNSLLRIAYLCGNLSSFTPNQPVYLSDVLQTPGVRSTERGCNPCKFYLVMSVLIWPSTSQCREFGDCKS